MSCGTSHAVHVLTRDGAGLGVRQRYSAGTERGVYIQTASAATKSTVAGDTSPMLFSAEGRGATVATAYGEP